MADYGSQLGAHKNAQGQPEDAKSDAQNASDTTEAIGALPNIWPVPRWAQFLGSRALRPIVWRKTKARRKNKVLDGAGSSTYWLSASPIAWRKTEVPHGVIS